MSLYKWSQIAASDASADPSINWAEGMSPAGVNDSGRAMMAAVAKYRDDIAGAIVTGGTSTAYTVASYQQFDSLVNLGGKEIAFTPHATNGATVTLSVDGLGNKPLRSAPGAELPSGVLIQGTPYVAAYNSADGVFYLRGFFGNPYNIPIGGSIDFWGPTAPNSSFAMMYGQAVSRSTYAGLFAIFGTQYGVGDGTTTFNLPDLRGRVVAGKGNMGGGDANLLNVNFFGADGTTLGATGGFQGHAIGQVNLPSVNFAISGIAVDTTFNMNYGISSLQSSSASQVGTGTYSGIGGSISMHNGVPAGLAGMSISTAVTSQGSAASGGSGTPLATVQPTIIANKIMRIM